MSNILSRSPHIIEIDETDQVSSRIQLYIWNGSTQPATPQYTLSKKIPASNVTKTHYDISPYIREYYSFDSYTGDSTDYANPTNTNHYCNVRVTRLVTDADGERSIDSTTYRAFDGYGNYEEGSNPTVSNVMLSEGDYTYKFIGGSDIVADQKNLTGSLTMTTGTSDVLRYTDLVTGASTSYNLANDSVVNVDRTYFGYRDRGNKIEYLTGGSTVSWTSKFSPIKECKYTPLFIDYINKQGAWSRIFLFKSSSSSISKQSKNYNVMQSNPFNYDVLKGQVKQFNTSANETIKGNTGFVTEGFYSHIVELMLSERVLVNNRPASVDTDSLDKQTGLNDKTMSYGLKFSFSNNVINSIA